MGLPWLWARFLAATVFVAKWAIPCSSSGLGQSSSIGQAAIRSGVCWIDNLYSNALSWMEESFYFLLIFVLRINFYIVHGFSSSFIRRQWSSYCSQCFPTTDLSIVVEFFLVLLVRSPSQGLLVGRFTLIIIMNCWRLDVVQLNPIGSQPRVTMKA